MSKQNINVLRSDDNIDQFINGLKTQVGIRHIKTERVIEEDCYLNLERKDDISVCNRVSLATCVGDVCPSSVIVCKRPEPELVCVPRIRRVNRFRVNHEDNLIFADTNDGDLKLDLPVGLDKQLLIIKAGKGQVKTYVDGRAILKLGRKDRSAWLKSSAGRWDLVV